MTTQHAHAPAHGHAVHDDDDGAVHVHIAPTRFYIGIFAALIVLTFITVKVSYYDFGAANIVIAMLVATMKATLVATFFMHLRHDKLFNTLAFIASFLFLGVFILLTYDDLGKRGQVDPTYGGTINQQTGAAAPGGEPATSATQDDVSDEAPPPPAAAAPAPSAAPVAPAVPPHASAVLGSSAAPGSSAGPVPSAVPGSSAVSPRASAAPAPSAVPPHPGAAPAPSAAPAGKPAGKKE